MSLKKYSELTEEWQKKILAMYQFSDKDNASMYLYNFDDNGNFHGRQYNPPEGETKDGLHFGRLHIEVEPKEEKEEVKEELPEKMIDTQPVKKAKKTAKK